MLTSQSNTQIYSPFGSYIVEQHGTGIDGLRSYPANDCPGTEQTQAERRDLPKAA